MSAAFTLDELSAMPAAELQARLSGSPEERAVLVGAAAEAGVAEAQAVYGQMLLDGHGVPSDARAAVGWFSKAAQQGHVMAINMIGRCYDLGWGVAVDKARAAQWYRAAADRGLDWGMYNLATLMALGHGVAEDKPAALALFRKAAAMGNAKAINFVGSFYEDGWVVEKDLAEAARCYARAAEGGDFRGQFNHARMLADAGRIDEALAWLARVPETATVAFREKAAAYLAASPLPELRAAAAAMRPADAQNEIDSH
ncbi:tetratricopeptide repeat protein [Flavisphingomonas formosensis]|uniref:tetratricopeptide repeat protein n=1 Tax=Flavisphingomonas formosensis TaxID=861534 RepID=UPI0012F943CC|nr:tetratricopeptide repeat protein [Sphingomonas formosensis]